MQFGHCVGLCVVGVVDVCGSLFGKFWLKLFLLDSLEGLGIVLEYLECQVRGQLTEIPDQWDWIYPWIVFAYQLVSEGDVVLVEAKDLDAIDILPSCF